MDPPSCRPLFGSTALFAEDAHGTCPFYLKIGACRHGDQCSRHHVRPTSSQTLLLQHLYPMNATRAGIKISSGEDWDDAPKCPVSGCVVADKAKHISWKSYNEMLKHRIRVAKEKGIVLGKRGEVIGSVIPEIDRKIEEGRAALGQLLQNNNNNEKSTTSNNSLGGGETSVVTANNNALASPNSGVVAKADGAALKRAASCNTSGTDDPNEAEDSDEDLLRQRRTEQIKAKEREIFAELDQQLPPLQTNIPLPPTLLLSEYEAAQRHLEEFYDEVWAELSSYGEIEDMIVADNVSEHMLGTVYLKYFTN